MSTVSKNIIETVWQIWLLNPINNSETIQQTLGQARSIIKHVNLFENILEFEQFLQNLSNYDRIVFIVDDLFAQEIIPKIHDVPQIFAIYIYTFNEQSDQSFYKQKFSKYRGRRSHTNKTRGDRRVRRNSDESFSFDILSNDTDEDKSTMKLDGQFLHSQLLVDSLQTMKSTSKEIEEFVQFCRDHSECKNSREYLKLLEEFQREYSSETCLWWYTRDTFVYRMLNKALRVQNIDVLFAFRFFIRDLAQQLKQNQWSSSGSVYRGQSLSKFELKRIQESIGKLISINSFLSTTYFRSVADFYIGDGGCGLEKVLFKIDFNPLIDGIKPFADITLISDFPQEGEILFMLGSIFQIEDVYCDENDSTWTIQLNLCSDNEQNLKSILQFLRQESNRCEFDLLAFGNVLHDMGEFEQAKNYYNRCLNFLPPANRIWKAYCYYLLGLVATENNENEHALQLFKQSLFIRKENLHSSDPSLADTYVAIARVYYIKRNFEYALVLQVTFIESRFT